jgi:hypothetical protein
MSNGALLGYAVVDTAYTKGVLGDITPSGSTLAANSNQVTGLNSDPTVHSFYDASGNLRVVVAQYGLTSPVYMIYDPTTNPWTKVSTNKIWSSISNLYGVVTLGSYLYAIDYDGAHIAKINMTNNAYSQDGYYTFAGTTGYQSNGVAITVLGGSVYGLFTTVDNPWATSPTYLASTVVKLDVSGTNPTAAAQASVGKNAFTLTPYGGKLYIASIGGKQQSGSYNTGESKLNVVTPGTTLSVATPFTANSTLPGDFRDITFSDSGDAYILTGYYDSSYANLNWTLYKTTATAINAATPDIGTTVHSTATSGYFWATLYEDIAASDDRFWFAKGNEIDIYQPAPTSGSFTALVSFSATTLAGFDANLNAVTPLWKASALALRHGSLKSFAAHAMLAAHARKAALELKDKK